MEGQHYPLETFTEYRKEPQQLGLQPTSPDNTQLNTPHSKQIDTSVVKAAFAFHNNVDVARQKRESQFTVTAASVPPTPAPDGHVEQEIRAHEARHMFRIRIARGIQHLITSALSLMIAIFQGSTYNIFQQTKDVDGAWPIHADVFPTLMLFSVAVVALVFDACAIIAYAFPRTKIGQKAFKVALGAHKIITTLKGVSYFLTVLVCREGFSQGKASGQNNDLWGWSCSAMGDKMSHVNQAPTICATNTVAWIMGIANVAIEVLGVGIDFFVKRDARKKKEGTFGAGWQTQTDPYSDQKPLFMSGAKGGKYQQISEDPLEQLDGYGDEIDGGLNESKQEQK
ncbi:hypothetical protein EJ08DRAFT_654627 [Tothia fuscella]|uniref:Uncharacterized protein n=1 Tax=Tothia fuscella TaxID=1048955 RepID=A0A9P4NE91_9PEZI|nr:hypothetical protein EJ08DRAFT_654627 [Tothia fuscella]